MASYQKKSFFKEPTAAQIRKRGTEVRAERDLVKRIEALQDDEFLIIPDGVFDFSKWGSEKKFKKHGPEVAIRRFQSIDDCLTAKKTPRQLMKERFDSVRKGYHKGYSFYPVDGRDRRRRVVPLVEVLEGAKLFHYAHNFPTTIEVEKAYSDSRRTKRDGAVFLVSLPSRRQKVRRYKMLIEGVPMNSSTLYRFMTPYRFKSKSLDENQDHVCGAKMFGELRFSHLNGREDSNVYRVCAHEVAAMYEIAYNNARYAGNKAPVGNMVFPLPTQRTVDFYNKLRRQVVLVDEGGKHRKMNGAHSEILLWNLVASAGFDETFNQNVQKDGHLEKYKW